jgi:hypothetical protein
MYNKYLYTFILLIFVITTSAQNVGIGTSAPTSKLDVNGQLTIDQKNFGGYGGLLIKGNVPGNNYPNICFTIRNNAATPVDMVAAYIGGNLNNNTAGSEAMDLTFMTSATGLGGLTERLLIKDNGNIGIGNTTPGFPLNFASAPGDKISLYGSSGNHYGFGVQSALLQIHADAAAANIGFGYGSSGSFTERMRIINSGGDGLSLNGRMVMRNGTVPLDINYGTGVWLYKADNSALLGFIGAQNNQNIGFYGGPGGWGFTYNAINSRVGIGNNNPNAPLAFAATLEKKITLYPGATGDVGFAVAGNRLQIYSDNPNADVAIGYDAAGTFNERFAVKANGALAVYGNTGAAGQVLKSNGAGGNAAWSGLGITAYQFNSTDYQLDLNNVNNTANLAGLHNQTITVNSNSIVTVNCRVLANNIDNAFGGNTTAILKIALLNSSSTIIGNDGVYQKIGNGEIHNLYCQFVVDNVPAGTYTTSAIIQKGSGDDFSTGSYYTVVAGTSNGNMIIQIIPK